MVAVGILVWQTLTMFGKSIRQVCRSRRRQLRQEQQCRSAQTRAERFRPLTTTRPLGDEISRDPIGKKGGLNLYEFVKNSPVVHVDPDGRQVMGPMPPGSGPIPLPRQYPPMTPFRDKWLRKKNDCSCCGQKEIDDGKKQLVERFNSAKEYLDGKGLVCDADADEPGEASCDTSNGVVLNFMNPTPKCWVCFMDRRWHHAPFGTWDENFIHCYSVNNKGIKDEIIFDWFDSAYYGGSDVYSDVERFDLGYPRQAPQYGNTPIFADCSSPENAWSGDFSKFDFMFDPNRKDPPANR